jgi:hypothetical protein
MLDVYKSWKVDYDKKVNDCLMVQFNGFQNLESVKTKRDDGESDDEASSKKLKTGVVCLPFKFVK